MRRSFNEKASSKGKNLIVFGSGENTVTFDFQEQPFDLMSEFGNLSVVDKHVVGADIDKLISRLEAMVSSDRHGNVSKKVLSRLKAEPASQETQLEAAREILEVGENRKSLEEREVQNFYLEIQRKNIEHNLGISDQAILNAIVFRYGCVFKGWSSVKDIRRRQRRFVEFIESKNLELSIKQKVINLTKT
ncbi:hypothetical protein IC617_03205 [Neiella sp. HB171785]|uniref:Uncharacterized protein n=1 Tax=Neiella litorisoli TaxID=2771431 RepID=A0A8J6UF44_9GAMM|nr:hypothetical protein [Neiella litorisoli]MBD1388426.1 hypothetical protein [Neiella litorisoli]